MYYYPFYNYHFFIIWPNGFSFLENILGVMRNEENLDIVSIQKRSAKNMKKFIFDLYASDSVPVHHLKSKLKYLYDLPPEYVCIFVRNYNPQEEYSGAGEFRKTQCKYIVSVKNRIRNLFNPKHDDPEFQILPLDKGVSHEHVTHASDREEQTDYFLKLLGYREGIKLLDRNDHGLLFSKPHHIRRSSSYTIMQIPVNDLYASIITAEGTKNLMRIPDTPHYMGFHSLDVYEDYLTKFQYTLLCDDYSLDKYLGLKSLTAEDLVLLPPIIVDTYGTDFVILDGVHRAAVYAYRNLEKIRCVVLND